MHLLRETRHEHPSRVHQSHPLLRVHVCDISRKLDTQRASTNHQHRPCLANHLLRALQPLHTIRLRAQDARRLRIRLQLRVKPRAPEVHGRRERATEGVDRVLKGDLGRGEAVLREGAVEGDGVGGEGEDAGGEGKEAAGLVAGHVAVIADD